MKHKCLIFLTTVGMSINAIGADRQYYYIVKKNQNVSTIILSAGLSPIYGRQGVLHQITAANPMISDINKVRPGQKVFFPKDLAERTLALGHIEIKEMNQISDTAHQPTLPKEKEKEVEAATSTYQSYSQFELRPRFYFLRQTGNNGNSKATLFSKLSTGLDFRWRQVWTPQFSTFLDIGSSTSEINRSNSRNILNRSQQLSHLGAGLTYQPNSETQISGTLRQEEQLFYRASSPTDLTVDSISTTVFDAELRQNIFAKIPFHVDYFVGGRYQAPISISPYDSDGGYGYGAGLSLIHRSTDFSLAADLGYREQEVHFETLRVRNSELSTTFRLLWHWGFTQ